MRKNIFDIYNEQHVNDVPKVIPNENYVKTENPETVKTDPEPKTDSEPKTDPELKIDPEPKTNVEDVGKSSLSEERG